MHVAVAGTFGPVHDGHRQLFEHALRFGDDGVVVGLASDDLAVETRRDDPRPIPSFGERTRAVSQTLAELDEWGRDVEIRELDDELGFASTDPSIDALVVSPETVSELEDVNDRRRERGLEPLTGIVAPYVLAEDGERISSTRMVRGEIDEHGATIDTDGTDD